MAKLVLLLVFVCFQFSKSEDLSAIEQIKLDLDEDDVPFTNQTGPDTEVLDGADEDQWPTGPKFNYDWLNDKSSSSEEAFNATEDKMQTILDKLIELAEMITDNSLEYSDEDYSYEWDGLLDAADDDDDYEYDEEAIKDWIYSADYKEAVKNKNSRADMYSKMISLLRPNIPKFDEAEDNLSEELQPVKRFTSV